NLDKLDIGKVGVYEIEYIAKDESNNETRVKVKVTVVDTVKPSIKNTKDLSFLVDTSLSKLKFLEGISVSDNYDKNISLDQLYVDYSAVNVNVPWVYPVVYLLS